MEKAFRPIPLELLARWIFGELEPRRHGPRHPAAELRRSRPAARVDASSAGTLAAPLGVAAGPHTPARAEHRRRAGSAAPASSSSRPSRSWTSSRCQPPLHRRRRRDLQLRVVAGAEARAVVRRVPECLGAGARAGARARAARARATHLQHERRLRPGGHPEPAGAAVHRRHARRAATRSRRRSRRWREAYPAVRDVEIPRRTLRPHHALDHARLPAGGDRADRALPPRRPGRPHLGEAQPDAARPRAPARPPEPARSASTSRCPTPPSSTTRASTTPWRW